jgi:hypothetical protein
MRPSPTTIRLLSSVAAVALLSACASKSQISAQQESSTYLSRAGRSYTPPGPSSDPWGPYIHEASTKYDVPQRWIREVMHQESGGHLYGHGGNLITSGAGAMGLMQVMPGTYDELRARYAELGDDPFDPHNNILAGTAYIREMYDIYGAPGFLAAYNAGPGRLDDYLTRSRTLPAETRRYVAIIGAKLGSDTPNRPSPGAQYAMNALPMQIPDGSRYASGAQTPAYSVAVANALNSAPPGALPPSEPIRLAAAAPIRLSPPVEAATAPPIRLSPPVEVASAAPIRLAPQPVEVAEAPPIRLAPQATQVASADYVPGGPIRLSPQPLEDFAPERTPTALVVPRAAQVADLPEPPEDVAPLRPALRRFAEAAPRRPTPQRFAEVAPPHRYAPLPAPPPEPPRQFASAQPTNGMPFSPSPRPLAFGLVSQAHAEPFGQHHAGPAMGGWAVQVGAFANESLASAATQSARGQAREVLATAHTVVAGVRQPRGVLYRARLTGLSRDGAIQACERLARSRTNCMVVSPDAQS